jgi:predicted small secreted protein
MMMRVLVALAAALVVLAGCKTTEGAKQSASKIADGVKACAASYDSKWESLAYDKLDEAGGKATSTVTDGIRAAITNFVNDSKSIAVETKTNLINQQLPTFISCLQGKFAT